jgi:hypothetical protein
MPERRCAWSGLLHLRPKFRHSKRLPGTAYDIDE